MPIFPVHIVLCLIRDRNWLPFPSTWVHPAFLVGSVLLIVLVFFCVVLLCVFTLWVSCCDVRYDFRIKRYANRLYFQLFVGGLISYLRYFRIVVSNTYCVVFLFCFSSSFVPCYQFPWIFHFWLPIRYSPPLILCQNLSPTYFPKYWIRVQMYFPMGSNNLLDHDVLSAWINDSMRGIFNHPSAWLLIKVRCYTLYCHLIVISGLLWSISNSPDNERNDMFVCVLFSASTIEIHLSGTTCLSVHCSQLAL